MAASKRDRGSIALVLVLSGSVAAACSSAPAEGVAETSQALTGGTACDGVQLDASRQYKPRSFVDGEVSFASGSLTFNVPGEIPVTQGGPDRGKAKFTFSNGGAAPITCIYRGDGATKYVFVRCKRAPLPCPDADDDDEDHDDGPRDLLPVPVAGSRVTASTFLLHVNKGNRRLGTTAVTLRLNGPVVSDDNACTTDACNGGSITHSPVDIDDRDECTVDACDPIAGTTHTAVDTAFCRGRASFGDSAIAGLGGNGRACSTCHIPSENFTLSPRTAEARYQALQAARVTNPAADDPLFRPVDADDFRINGAAASDYTNLRTLGLSRITLPLPSNIRLVGPNGQVTAETSVDVWRTPLTVENVKLTGPDGFLPVWGGPPSAPPRAPGLAGPNTRGGYQNDASIDTLQNQAFSAFFAHLETTGTPQASTLDDIAAYEKAIFSSEGARDLSSAIDANASPLPDPDPVLDALEQQGKAVFTRSCAQCHGGSSTATPIVTAPIPLQRYFDILITCPRPVDGPMFGNPSGPARWSFPACSPGQAKNTRVYEIRRVDPATGNPVPPIRLPSSDPGRALLTGFVNRGLGPNGGLLPFLDDWQKFDSRPLRGVAKTAPYFHNNSAATLSDVLDHYTQLFKFVQATSPPGFISPVISTDNSHIDRPFLPEERAALLAYLQKL